MSTMKEFFREWVLPIGLALLVVVVVRTYVGEARYIPSGSMIPTLEIYDVVLINKLDKSVQRGDIVIFDPPSEAITDKVLIKRVIGLPGETIALRDGVVFIDGQPLEEPYVKEPAQVDFGPVTVPEGSYFMMGDNRNNSSDSRSWGPLPGELICGKAFFKIFPFTKMGRF